MTINSKTIGYILAAIAFFFMGVYFIQSWFGDVNAPNGAWLMGLLAMIGSGFLLFRDHVTMDAEQE